MLICIYIRKYDTYKQQFYNKYFTEHYILFICVIFII